MDIFEKDAQQKEEELQQWWKDNWKGIIGGITLAIVLIISFWTWRDYRIEQKRLSTTELYQVINFTGNEGEAVTKLAAYVVANQNTYGELASLKLVNEYVKEGKYEDAYNALTKDTKLSGDDILNDFVYIRQARLAIELKKYDEASKHLTKVKNAAFKATVTELEGDIALAQGNKTDAFAKYEKALLLTDAKQKNELLRLKRDSLKTVSGFAISPELQTQVKEEKAEVKEEKAEVAPVEEAK